jgi:hypothetical protein
MYSRQVPPCMMWGQVPMSQNNQNIMPMTNMPTNMMPMQSMPMEDKDLEMLYPKIYLSIIPMVRMHCDKMESKYGVFFCPSKKEMEDIIEEINERLEKDMDDDDEKCKKNKKDKCREEEYLGEYEEDTRQRRRYSRRRLLKDLISIVLLGELLGRRHRRRPYYGYGGY